MRFSHIESNMNSPSYEEDQDLTVLAYGGRQEKISHLSTHLGAFLVSQQNAIPLSHFHSVEAFSNATPLKLFWGERAFLNCIIIGIWITSGQLSNNSLVHRDGIFSMRGIPRHILPPPTSCAELQ